MLRRYAHPAALLSSVLLCAGLALAPSPARAAGGVGDLYVTSDASNLVRAYVGPTGSFLGVHTSSVGPATGQLAIHFGETNNRVLVGHFSGGVNEFNANTGAFIKTYAPGGGWMWSAIYRPNGDVYVASTSTDEVLEYDGATGAFIRVLATFPPATLPSDMRYGPNGNLYVCAYGAYMVYELHPNSGAILGAWSMPTSGARPNDIAFLPNGEVLVTNMGVNVCYRFDPTPAHTLLGSFAGTGWDRPHGIDISPVNGHIFIVDGVTTQVHEFDPVTFTELNAAYLTPGPGDKIVDLEFRRENLATEARPSTWGRLKALYR
jgi:streptogramin lyase